MLLPEFLPYIKLQISRWLRSTTSLVTLQWLIIFGHLHSGCQSKDSQTIKQLSAAIVIQMFLVPLDIEPAEARWTSIHRKVQMCFVFLGSSTPQHLRGHSLRFSPLLNIHHFNCLTSAKSPLEKTHIWSRADPHQDCCFRKNPHCWDFGFSQSVGECLEPRTKTQRFNLATGNFLK